MADVDAVATVVATGGGTDNPAPATQHNQADAKGAAAPETWGTVDEELIRVVKVKGWKSPADAVKSYVDLEKFSSKTVQDMSSEERDKFMKRLGRPESADAYELSNVTLPNGLPRSKEADKELKELMWKVQALPLKEQPKAVHEWAMKKAADGFVAQKQAQAKFLEQNESDLRKSWGLEYDANWTVSDKAAKLGGDEFVQWLNDGPGKLAVVRKALHAIGKLMSDDTLVQGPPPPKDQIARPGLVFDPSKFDLANSKR